MDKAKYPMDVYSLQASLARLESLHDHMASDLQDLDVLLRVVGFAEGIHSLRLAAQELLELTK